MFNVPRILIIGAGAAGMSAAARLLENGLQNIVILEAKDRVGGRIYTTEFSENVVDLGAQWVHGERGNIVFDLAFPHNLLASWENFNDFSKHVFVTAEGEIVPTKQSTEVLKMYYDISDRATECLKNATCSYGEYFVNEFYKILGENPTIINRDRAEQFLDWIEKFDNSIQCSDTWLEVSAKGITEYWHCDGDSVLNWKNRGYKTLFDLLSKKIPGQDQVLPIKQKVELNKEVCAIDYSSKNTIIVTTTDGSQYTASHVIFTASLGVLKERHSMIFSPPLPEEKQRAIKGLSFGCVNKVFLEFPYRWWEDTCATFSLLWSQNDKREFLESHRQSESWLLDVFGFFTVDCQSRVLCAWIVGKSARFVESLTNEEVEEGLCMLLEKFLGKTYDIPVPDQILRSKWYTDKHFRGAYSYRSMVTDEMNARAADLAEPILTSSGKPILLFAGEATHDHYYSTVHGAVESGFREADRIIEFHRRFKSHL